MPIASPIFHKHKCPVKRGGRFIDKTGQKSGRLTVVSFFDVVGHDARWLCRCECGNERVIRSAVLNGKTKSCGCLIGKSFKHGAARNNKRTKEYRVWSRMKERCGNPHNDNFEYYGGRGIKVCKRWLESFQSFLDDMGEMPVGMTIERKNTNGDYEPSNCIWASNFDQQSNRRNNKIIEFNGIRYTQAQLARKTGCDESTIAHRIMAGWEISKIVNTPPNPGKQRFK